MPVQTNVHTPAISVLVPAASCLVRDFADEDLFNLVDGLFIHGVDPLPSFPPEKAGNQDRRAGLFGRPDLANASYGAIAEHSL